MSLNFTAPLPQKQILFACRRSLKGGFEAWKNASEDIDLIIEVEPDELAIDIKHDPKLTVVDVRRETEFGEGHIKNAINLPLSEMTDVAQIATLDDNQNLYIHCAGGYRSIIASSLIKRQGYQNLRNVIGGFDKIKEEKDIEIDKEASVLNQYLTILKDHHDPLH